MVQKKEPFKGKLKLQNAEGFQENSCLKKKKKIAFLNEI